MKPIDSITIDEALELAQEDLKRATVTQVAGAIKDVLCKITNAKIKLARSEAEVEANKKALAGFEGQLAKIKEGDWAAIPEMKPEKGADDTKGTAP